MQRRRPSLAQLVCAHSVPTRTSRGRSECAQARLRRSRRQCGGRSTQAPGSPAAGTVIGHFTGRLIRDALVLGVRIPNCTPPLMLSAASVPVRRFDKSAVQIEPFDPSLGAFSQPRLPVPEEPITMTATELDQFLPASRSASGIHELAGDESSRVLEGSQCY
jgi:hypothetical protein